MLRWDVVTSARKFRLVLVSCGRFEQYTAATAQVQSYQLLFNLVLEMKNAPVGYLDVKYVHSCPASRKVTAKVRAQVKR